MRVVCGLPCILIVHVVLLPLSKSTTLVAATAMPAIANLLYTTRNRLKYLVLTRTSRTCLTPSFICHLRGQFAGAKSLCR